MFGTTSKRLLIFLSALLLGLSFRVTAQQAAWFIDFDGTNDYVSVADADSLSFGNATGDTPFTIETWVRPDGTVAKQNLLSKWAEGAGQEYRFYIAANSLRIDLHDGSANAMVSAFGGSSLQGAWHHLAVTYDGRGGSSAASGITIYVDGNPIALFRQNNAAYIAMENTTATLELGGEGPGSKQLNGALDDVRLWGVSRTQSEIQSHMTIELDGSQAGLVAYWKFNEGNGTNAVDSGLGTHAATLFNAVLWTPGGPVGPSNPDVTAPVIGDISPTNITDSGITIAFTTDEPTTGWVSLTATGVCPCIDVYSTAVGTSHTIVVGGLAQDTPYSYFVKAIDSASNLTVAPELGFRTLVTPEDLTPPVVSITNPQAGTVSGNVILTASATDNLAVAGVQFKVDGVDFGSEDTSFPYSLAWDASSIAEGPHEISAVARDTSNNTATAVVSVTVSSAPTPDTPFYLEFDGVDDYLQIADTDDLSFGSGVADSALTFEFWFRPDAVATGKQNILSKWLEAASVEYRIYLAQGTLRVDFSDSSSGTTVSAFTRTGLLPLQGTWHHVAVTYDGRGGATAATGLTIYIDGVPVSVARENNAAYVAMENWAAPLQIGRQAPNSRQFRGALDEVRIWNVVRSESQIQGSMHAEFTGPQPGLVAYWKFNEGAGPTADEAVGGHTATLFNGTVWAPGGPISSPSQQAPVITSGNSTTFVTGVTGSFAIAATGQPTPILSSSGALPSGVSFSDHGDGTAILGGTPGSGTGGSYPLTISASNGAGQPATQPFTLTINQPPAITSAAAATFQSGTPGTFAVTSSGFPNAAISLTGALPAGVTFTSNGDGSATIAGSPAAGGTYALTIAASNGISPQAAQSFVLTVNQPPAITSGAAAALQIGVPGSFVITTSGYPVPALSASGVLPGGVSFADLGNGSATIAGTPAAGSGGSYALTIAASNGVGSAASQNLVLTVPDCVLAPAPGALQSAVFGLPYSFAFLASGGSGHAFALGSGSVASGLTLSSGGVLSGTPTTTGSFTFTVAATNSTGCVASNSYTMQVTPNAQDESFENAVGNTQFSVGAGTPATPAVVTSGSVLTNDAGPGSITAGPANIVSANGGVVAMASDGRFLYTPPAGFAGPADSFTYTLTDGNGASDTAVVNINMSGVVWYVNSTAGAGDGRSSSPFNTMTPAAAAAQTGQVIYVHSGSPAGAFVMKTGQSLLGAGSLFTLNGLTIPAAAQPTIAGTITLANDVYLRSLSVNAGAAGAAIVANGLSGLVSLEAVSILGGTTGLDLSDLAGTLAMIGGSISGVSAGAEVRISGGTGDVSIGAPITNTGAKSIDIQSRTSGTVTFSGAISDTGAGILLSANTGSTINFTGGLTLSTAASAAFTATGGGTVTVTQDNVSIINTITTTSGTALSVVNTDIGAAGLTFRRITAGTSVASAGSGIILDTTGLGANNGGLTITGNGTAQSGGIIRRKSGPDGSFTQGVGISLSNTKNPSFRWMELNGFDNAAIAGRNVVGLSIANSLVTGAGNTALASEAPIVLGQPGVDGFNGLQGSGVIRDTVISGGFKHNLIFYNRSGTMTLLLERTGPTPGQCQVGLNSATTGGHGLLVDLSGTATGTVTVNRCRFRDNREASLIATASDDSQLHLVVTGSASDAALKSEFVRTPSGQGQEGVVVMNSGNAVVTATIENAVFNAYAATGIRLGQQTGNASALSLLQATVTGNSFAMTGSGNGGGIVGAFSSSAGQVSRTRLLLANNHVNQYAVAPAFNFAVADDGATPQVDLTLNGNHADMRESSPGSGIRGQIGMNVEAHGGALCSSTANNISHLYPVGVSPQAGGIRLLQSGSALVGLEQGNQPLDSSASVVLSANNPAPLLSVMVTEALGTISVVSNGSCVVPSTP